MPKKNPFKYFQTSQEIIRLAVMYYVRYPLSFRQVEDILHERGIDISHETVRVWVKRYGLEFAGEIRRNERAFNLIGAGMWMRSSSILMESCITYGER
jgi:putative transposase